MCRYLEYFIAPERIVKELQHIETSLARFGFHSAMLDIRRQAYVLLSPYGTLYSHNPYDRKTFHWQWSDETYPLGLSVPDFHVIVDEYLNIISEAQMHSTLTHSIIAQQRV